MLMTDEAKEVENVKLLTEMMGEHSDREVALRVLRKYEGDVEKAAMAMLEGERGDDDQSRQIWGSVSQMDVVSHKQPSAPSFARQNTPVVDLTGDDDGDLQRAMKESMSTLPQPAPVFGPSERPADSNWAMVLSNQEGNQEANYQQNLERAIEASLEHNNANDSDALEPFPIEQQLRRDGCPVVLRPSIHTMCYAAAILQGLFYVPQVRKRMASWRPTVMSGMMEVNVPTSGTDFTLWALSEIFTHMDLARLCDLNVDKHLCAFNIEPWTSLMNPLGELSRKFYTRLVATLEKAFLDQLILCGYNRSNSRLFHFLYGESAGAAMLQETCIVPIDINPGGGGSDANDLIGRLSAQLSKPQDAPEKQSVIVEPSEVVAFQLSKPSPSYSNNTSTSSAAKPFVYPRSIYLDQFLQQNVEFAEAKRRQQHDLFSNVQKLILHKKSMTHFNGKDTLKDLRSTIYYYEHVADDKGDPERTSSIRTTTEKLKSILEAVELEIKATDQLIHRMREEALTLLDCPELKQVRYDLRVVFMHDGLYGRKHLYCYVRDKGQWWRIADSLIERVTEESVLGDTTGLHLGAGPYLLLYSRYRPDEDERLISLPWPPEIKDDVKECNKAFLAQLPPELVKDIKEEHTPSSQNGTFSQSVRLTDLERRSDGMDVS
ncbi:hypothetical protein EDD17DRAFT_1556658 [Pisolithus thermaeus]|nr:hypothetical protein EDD17DRAFT_1556658 [Pisolithus thermaeus]